MKATIRFADLTMEIEAEGFDIEPDEKASQFYYDRACGEEPEKIRLVPVQMIPAVGGTTVWENPVCVVKRSGEYEIRIHRDAVSGLPFAMYADRNGEDGFAYVQVDWLNAYKDSVMLFNVLGLEKRLAGKNKIVFHCCYTEADGQAILFSGNSGAGKSTQGALWEKHCGAAVINGDRSLIGVSADTGKLMAYGFPFSGTSGICYNKTMPIRAIVFIKQAPKNRIRRLEYKEAVGEIWKQLTVNQWNPGFIDCAIHMAEETAGRVPVYELSCTPDERAVNCLKERLTEDGL